MASRNQPEPRGEDDDQDFGRSTADYVRDMLPFLIAAVLLVSGALWFLLRLVQPAPPAVVTIATGGASGAYHGFGKRYAEVLARSGVKLEVKSTAGSIENLRLLKAPGSGVDLALLQGGISNTQESPDVVSLGRVFVEPLWVFYRGAQPIDMLHQLKGRRIAVGAEGSGTRHLASALLAANQIDATSASLLPVSGKAAADGLLAGEIDAIFLAMAPESQLVQDLMRDPRVQLMSFSQAEAYTRRMSYLQRLTLPKGAFDFVRNVPDRDIVLVAPKSSCNLTARTGAVASA